jgi:acyl-coenzyme A synthetase/AMP-(fatty) acid ligase
MARVDEDGYLFMADKIAKYKIPRTFKFVETLPHTASGKVKKYRLRDE